MATYTSADDIDDAAVAASYGLTRLTLEPLGGGAANSSFKATASQGTFVLTILDNHDHASACRLALHTEAMFRLGMPTAEVVHNARGDAVSTIRERPVLLKHWIPGHAAARLTDDGLREAGDMLARLHDLPPAEVPDLPVGTRRLSALHLEAIDEFPDQEFADWLRSGLATVRAQEDRLTDGSVICHGDVFTDNLIVRPDETLAIIDWETVSLDGPLLDLGMTLLGLANENGHLDKERADRVISGYAARRPLNPEQYATLPWEVEHAALIIAFHRYYRHNVRFPDPTKSHIYREMVGFVNSVGRLDWPGEPSTGRPQDQASPAR